MSDEIIPGNLTHYDNEHIKVRKDFFDICAYDKAQFNIKKTEKNTIIKDEPNQECMAKILRIIESLADTEKQKWYLKALHAKEQGLKIGKEPSEYRVKLSYRVICILLYNTYGDNTVRNSVAELIRRGYIIRYQAKNNDIPEYVLNSPVLQKALKDRAELRLGRVLNSTATIEDGDEEENRLLNSTPQGSEINTPGVRNQQAGMLNSAPNNIRNKDVYTKEEEKITAQSPIGSVLNVSSPSPVYTQEDEPTPPIGLQQTLEKFTPKRSNPRPSAPPKEGKNTPPKQASKQAVDPTELERVKSACEKAVGSRFMWIPEELRYAKTLAEGHATDEEIGMVVQRLKKTWSKDNITAKTICIHFGNQLSQAALSIPADTSTQQEEDRISRYNDPNFDPYTLSFPEYAAWTEWKKQHQPDPVLA